MSTHNICFCGELTKIILQLSGNNLLICSSESINGKSELGIDKKSYMYIGY